MIMVYLSSYTFLKFPAFKKTSNYWKVLVAIYMSSEKETQTVRPIYRRLHLEMIFISGEFSFCFKPQTYLSDSVEINALERHEMASLFDVKSQVRIFQGARWAGPELEQPEFSKFPAGDEVFQRK